MRVHGQAELAKLVGVSQATISRVVNKSSSVSKATRERVLKAMEEYDYRPHGIARSFATKKTGNIGFVLCDETLCHPYYFKVLDGILHCQLNKGCII